MPGTLPARAGGGKRPRTQLARWAGPTPGAGLPRAQVGDERVARGASGRRMISVTVGRVMVVSSAVDAPERVIFRNPFGGIL